MPTPWAPNFSELLALLMDTNSRLPPGTEWALKKFSTQQIEAHTAQFPCVSYVIPASSLSSAIQLNECLCSHLTGDLLSHWQQTQVRSLIQGHMVRKDVVSEETSSVKQGSENRRELRWQSSECSITQGQPSGLIPTVDLQGFGLQRLGVVKGNLQLTSYRNSHTISLCIICSLCSGSCLRKITANSELANTSLLLLSSYKLW